MNWNQSNDQCNLIYCYYYRIPKVKSILLNRFLMRWIITTIGIIRNTMNWTGIPGILQRPSETRGTHRPDAVYRRVAYLRQCYKSSSNNNCSDSNYTDPQQWQYTTGQLVGRGPGELAHRTRRLHHCAGVLRGDRIRGPSGQCVGHPR